MKKKALITILLLLLCCMTVILSGCGKNNGTEKVLRLTIAGNPVSLDVRKQEESEGIFVCQQIYEGLTLLNASNDVIPAGAESWEISPDGLIYRFHLRHDAKWSDGKAVTAHDYAYSWTTAISPEFANKRAEDFFDIKNGKAYNAGQASKDSLGIKALDDYTLQVTLEHPLPYFLQMVAKPLFSPINKAAVENNANWLNSVETMSFNGPFRIVSYAPNSRIELVKNEQYYDAAKVKMPKVTILISDNGSTRLSMFESGQVDYCAGPPPNEVVRLLKSNKLILKPKLAYYYYDFNTQRPPFDDVRVRKALAYAINRNFIVEKILRAGQKPAMAVVPFGMPDAAENSDFRVIGGDLFSDNNVETAKKLLADAGFKDGAGFPEVVLKYNTNEGHKMIAESVQEMWKQNLGVNVVLQNEEWKVFLDTRNKGDFDIARMGGTADVADPSTFLMSYLSDSELNNSKWKNKEFDRLMHAAEYELDRDKRFSYMHEAEKVLIDEMPIMPIYFYTGAYLINSKLRGYVTNSLDCWYFKEAYMD